MKVQLGEAEEFESKQIRNRPLGWVSMQGIFQTRKNCLTPQMKDQLNSLSSPASLNRNGLTSLMIIFLL